MKRLVTLDPEWRARAAGICRARSRDANERGRSEYGQQWGPDIKPCVDSGHVCGDCEREALASFGEQTCL